MDRSELLKGFEEFLKIEGGGCEELDVEGWKGYEVCWNGYGPRGGMAVRHEGVFCREEILLAIIDMLHFFFKYLADRLPTGHEAEVYVEPSCEDASTVVVLRGKKVLGLRHFEAWNFYWDTPQDLALALERCLDYLKAGDAPPSGLED